MGWSWVNVLVDVPMFAGLPKRQLGRIAELAVEKRMPAYTEIVRAGDIGRSFFVILDGTATVRREGKRPVRLTAGDFFGEMALLDGGPRAASVVADTEMLVMMIGRKDFIAMLEREPKVAVKMLTAIATRLRAAQSSPKD